LVNKWCRRISVEVPAAIFTAEVQLRPLLPVLLFPLALCSLFNCNDNYNNSDDDDDNNNNNNKSETLVALGLPSATELQKITIMCTAHVFWRRNYFFNFSTPCV